MRKYLPILLTFGLAAASLLAAESFTVTSPNRLITVTLQLAGPAGLGGANDGLGPCYRVECGPVGHRTVVIQDSPLGLQMSGHDFLGGFKSCTASPARLLDETYTVPHGKRRECHHRANEVTLTLQSASSRTLEMDFRACDDGVAFRYRVPGPGAGPFLVEREATGFALPLDARLWLQPSDKATIYAPSYETYYENEIAVGTPAPLGVGWAFPVLFRTGDSHYWGLITEAGVGPNFCAARLSNEAPQGVYRIAWPDPREGNGMGAVQPSSTLPWEMPWRVIILGDSLAGIVESTLVEDVCPPSRVQDTGWIKPGRVAWSWWSDPTSSTDAAKQMKFVDLAAAMGWEYVLVDANWTIMDHGNIHDVIRYAKKKGVGVLLWYNSGGPHNVVTEKPRDSLCFKEVRQFEFDLLRQWGVKGVKVDFFQSDKQDVIGLYHGIMQDAAERQIMVNFHGCTLPRGWSRTYPHLMAMEAVRGSECYIFDSKFPSRAPMQNTITPFTRNVVGPMDYTPVAFTAQKNPHLTTFAHELALSVLFESGWLHFADKPEAYLKLPAAPKRFLKQVPVTWDDTRLVAGYPGRLTILARRKGTDWYLAGVNGEAQSREERVKLGAWLSEGQYELTQIGDGANGRCFASKIGTVRSGEDISARMLPYGGFVAWLKKRP